ncbi:unnamed protein product [Prorocentrum cordatum]|uniref:Uncharacterized protein n=1 Tax=Prorocentrum cordatum TaxID=2364126 RepID=A0ABN9XSZ3_9DINO|nr:unnamed protein product [Polarella glacialis]
MTSVMDNIAALGGLTRAGNALAQTRQQLAPPAANRGPPPAASPATLGGPTEPARELVGALTEVIRSSSPGDSRLQQAIARPRDLVGIATPTAAATAAGSTAGAAPSSNPLAANPIIQQLQNDVATLQSTVGTHGLQISTINEISAATTAPMPCEAWWSQIARCKGISQWQVKLQSLGMPASDTAGASSSSKIGQIVYSRLQYDGSWSEADLQAITFQ